MSRFLLASIIMPAIGLAFAGLSCDMEESEERAMSIPPDTRSELEVISSKRVLFGHQSVGSNILEGLEEVAESTNVPGLKIISPAETTATASGFFIHAKIGKNFDPESKCVSFTELIHRLSPLELDIAFMKFCYLDFSPSTDAASIFSLYSQTVDSIERAYPSLIVVHVTVPLTTREPFLKRVARVVLGKSGPDDALVRRNEFNQLLLQTYEGKPIFDLARIESTYPDGSRMCFEKAGRKVYSLVPEYTDDGGHLNVVGRRIAALELVKVLAAAASGR